MNKCAYLAEAIGTFTLVFIGAGCAALGFGGLTGVALAHGFVIITMAMALGSVSGGHFNPSVSLAMALRGALSWSKAVAYMLCQSVGAIIAALCLSYLLSTSNSELGMTMLNSQLTPMQGIMTETILTFFLVFVILRVSRIESNFPLVPFAAGLTLSFAILMGGPLTGASLNFARSLGPAVAMGQFCELWIYLVGPFLGSVIAWTLDCNCSCQKNCGCKKST